MSKYIDADAMIIHLSDYALTESPNDTDSMKDRLIHETAYNAINECIKTVEEMPAADVELVERWISVDEKLPDNDKDVIAYSDDGEETRIIPANFVNGVWYDCLFNKICLTITHWMNLPEPPKTDGGSEE